jgi:hypothetical protein
MQKLYPADNKKSPKSRLKKKKRIVFDPGLEVFRD